MLKLLFLLLLLTLAICGHGQTKERKKQKKELIRKQKEMEDALKDVDPDDITGWSVQTVVAQLDEKKNMECRVIQAMTKGEDGGSLEMENAVVCQQQGLEKDTWYVKIVEVKEKKTLMKKGKKNIEVDQRFFEVFKVAKTKGLEFKSNKEKKGQKKKDRNRKKSQE